MIKIESGTAGILMTLCLSVWQCLVVGGGWVLVVDLSNFRIKANFWVELRLSWGCHNNYQVDFLILKKQVQSTLMIMSPQAVVRMAWPELISTYARKYSVFYCCNHLQEIWIQLSFSSLRYPEESHVCVSVYALEA